MANFSVHSQIPNVLTKEQLQALLENLTPSLDIVDNDTITLTDDKLAVNNLDDKVKSGIEALLDPETLAFSDEGKLGVVTTTILKKIYPVGSIYENANVETNPVTLLGFGEWEAFGEGKVLVGIDTNENPDEDFATAEKTGGDKTHTLTKPELPSHSHETIVKEAWTNDFDTGGGGPSYIASGVGTTGSTGSNQPHNNLQPYIVVYRWVRTA